MPTPDDNVYEELRALRQELADARQEIAAARQDLTQQITALGDLTRVNQAALLAAVADVAAAVQTVLAAVEDVEADLTPPVAAAVQFAWADQPAVTYPIINTGEPIVMSSFDLPDSDSATCTLAVVDQAQNPFTPSTAPVWTPDSATFVTLTVAADGMSATAVPVPGAGVGTTNVTIQVTNDDGTAATPLVTSVTTMLTDAASESAVWADSGVTVTAAPPAAS
jgi:uncharacterized protein YukE